jgi:hypothetical protein
MNPTAATCHDLPSPAAPARHARMSRHAPRHRGPSLRCSRSPRPAPRTRASCSAGRSGATPSTPKTPLTSVRQCSELGISRVRITTAEKGTNEDTREYPCFPDEFSDPTAPSAAPRSAPATYDVTITALTRRGIPRPTPSDAGRGRRARPADGRRPRARRGRHHRRLPPDSASTSATTASTTTATARRPGDTPCRLGQTAEDLDISGALFTFQATLLGGNPAATCAGLGLSLVPRHPRRRHRQHPQRSRAPLTQSFSADLPPASTPGRSRPSTSRRNAAHRAAHRRAQLHRPRSGLRARPDRRRLHLDTFLGEPAFNEPLRFSLEYEPYPDAPLHPPSSARPRQPCGSAPPSVTLQGATADASRRRPIDPRSRPMPRDTEFPLDDQCVAFEPHRVTTSPVERRRLRRLPPDRRGPPRRPDDREPCFSNAAAPARLAPGFDSRPGPPRPQRRRLLRLPEQQGLRQLRGRRVHALTRAPHGQPRRQARHQRPPSRRPRQAPTPAASAAAPARSARWRSACWRPPSRRRGRSPARTSARRRTPRFGRYERPDFERVEGMLASFANRRLGPLLNQVAAGWFGAATDEEKKNPGCAPPSTASSSTATRDPKGIRVVDLFREAGLPLEGRQKAAYEACLQARLILMTVDDVHPGKHRIRGRDMLRDEPVAVFERNLVDPGQARRAPPQLADPLGHLVEADRRTPATSSSARPSPSSAHRDPVQQPPLRPPRAPPSTPQPVVARPPRRQHVAGL